MIVEPAFWVTLSPERTRTSPGALTRAGESTVMVSSPLVAIEVSVIVVPAITSWSIVIGLWAVKTICWAAKRPCGGVALALSRT